MGWWSERWKELKARWSGPGALERIGADVAGAAFVLGIVLAAAVVGHELLTRLRPDESQAVAAWVQAIGVPASILLGLYSLQHQEGLHRAGELRHTRAQLIHVHSVITENARALHFFAGFHRQIGVFHSKRVWADSNARRSTLSALDDATLMETGLTVEIAHLRAALHGVSSALGHDALEDGPSEIVGNAIGFAALYALRAVSKVERKIEAINRGLVIEVDDEDAVPPFPMKEWSFIEDLERMASPFRAEKHRI